MSLIAASSILMMEPLPNCFSICDSAAASAFDLLSSMLYPFFRLLASTAGALGKRWAGTEYCINVHALYGLTPSCQSAGVPSRAGGFFSYLFKSLEIFMAKAAFLGLGVMGYPMAGHLLKKGGHDVTVYNRTPAKAQQWAKEYGGKHAATPRAAAKACDFVMLAAGTALDLRSVVYGPDGKDSGALAGMEKGAILVDHTTASAVLAK